MIDYCPQHGYPIPCDKCGYGDMRVSLFDLTGKKALVTGGKGLLAPIWVETLESAGAKVKTFDLPECDVTKKEGIKALANYYTPDIIINNAAIDSDPNSKATFFWNYDGIIDVNLIGALNICDAFIPKMKANKGGVIINIGSIQGFIAADWRNYPDPQFEKPIAYNLSKAAYLQLARSITVQYGRYGIRSVTIAFAAYDGGKLKQDFLDRYLKCIPMGRTVSKKSLQQALLAACCIEDWAGYTLLVDGGYTAW